MLFLLQKQRLYYPTTHFFFEQKQKDKLNEQKTNEGELGYPNRKYSVCLILE